MSVRGIRMFPSEVHWHYIDDYGLREVHAVQQGYRSRVSSTIVIRTLTTRCDIGKVYSVAQHFLHYKSLRVSLLSMPLISYQSLHIIILPILAAFFKQLALVHFN